MPQAPPPRPRKPGTTIQVIGAGLPRTGTVSFCAALEILYDAPAYHGGQRYTSADESHVHTWLDVLSLRPYATPAAKQTALARMRECLDGFCGTADPPLSMLIPELVELYPEALVVCTVRDPKKWLRSFMEMREAVLAPQVVGLMFYWMPGLRFLPQAIEMVGESFRQRFGERADDEAAVMRIWERQQEMLREEVPEGRLLFFDVREGWEPLCKALGKPVPDVPFPRLNEAASLKEGISGFVTQGLMRWAMVVGGVVAVLAVGVVVYSGRR